MTWEDYCREFREGMAEPDSAAADRLTVWLEGLGLELPPDEPAYPTIFRLGVYTESTGRLSALSAALLERWIAGDWVVAVDLTNAAYNLLHLAAELRDPSRLAAPVWRLYRKRLVQGSRPGAALTAVLLEAMIANQKGDEPEAVGLWKKLLAGQKDEYAGGSVEQGFRGMVNRYPVDGDLLARALRCVLRLGTQMADRLLEYFSEVHPGFQIGPFLSQARERDRADFLQELTRERNRRARAMLIGNRRPLRMEQWNKAWLRNYRKASLTYTQSPPQKPEDRDQMKNDAINRLFKEASVG